MKKLKLAVVGAGYLGKYHIEKYVTHPGVDLVAIVDIQKDRANKYAVQYGVPVYTDYRQILSQVDAASIVVPTESHYEIAKTCLEAGIDILVEKPITQEVWQAERLIQLAEKHGRVLQVGHLERFNAAILKAKTYLTEPLFIECHRLNSFVGRGTDVDVVLDLMIHDLDIILSLVQSKPVQIDAVGVPVLSSNIDITNVRLKFESGCVANVTASRISMKPMRKMRIFQRDAYVAIDFQDAQVEMYRKVLSPGNAMPEIQGEQLDLQKNDALAEEIKAFVKAIQQRSIKLASSYTAMEALRLGHDIIKQIKQTVHQFDPSIGLNHPSMRI